MRCGNENDDPRNLYEDYVKDLVLVARCGRGDTRYRFLLHYAEQLHGLSNLLAFLAETEQRAVFFDALRSSNGDWPLSFAGTRLAAPPWFRQRVSDPLGVWRATAPYSPDRLEIDPVCGMIIDPSETPYISRRNGVDVYFCCSACLEQFERNTAWEAVEDRSPGAQTALGDVIERPGGEASFLNCLLGALALLTTLAAEPIGG